MSAAYAVGRALGRHWQAALVLLAVCAAAGYFLNEASKRSDERALASAAQAEKEKKAKAEQLRQQAEAKREADAARLREQCKTGASELVLEARKQLKSNPELVLQQLAKCEGMGVAAIDQLQAQAKAESAQREAEQRRVAQRAHEKALAEERSRKRREGVSIGMSQQDVLDSSWGKPQRVNRTTSARGTTEQWVYGGRNYLYFENGVLRTIQN